MGLTENRYLYLKAYYRLSPVTILSEKEQLFPGEQSNFADSLCESWDAISKIRYLPACVGSDIGCELSTILNQLLPVTTDCLQKVLATTMSQSTHSMQVERKISHYNNINIRLHHRLSMGLHGYC